VGGGGGMNPAPRRPCRDVEVDSTRMFRFGGLTGSGVGKLLDVASSMDERIPARAEVAPTRAADARWVTEAGRAVLVFMPCYTIMGPRFSTGVGVAAALLLTAIWLICLRSAFAAVHFTLGLPIRCAVGAAMGFVGASAVALWVPGLGMSGWTILALAASVFTLTTIWEAVAQRVVAKRRVLVVGTSSSAAEIADAVEFEGRSPFAVVGVVDDEPDDPARLGSIAELSRIIDEQRPDLIVLTDAATSAKALDRLLAAPTDGFKVVGLAHFFDHAFGRIPLDDLSPTWFMSILHVWRRPYTRFAKRTFDVVCASIALVLTAPLWAVIALCVWLTPGPVIYRQTRVGERGRLFTMLKFRTMCVDAEMGEASYTQVGDARVTRLGRVLRMTHLDELPQLWNVLKGDMSVVGPRPERPEFIPMLEEAVPFFSRRLLIKPGVTGWAQLRSDYSSDAKGAADKLSYDLWYLRHRNLVVDLAICAKTFLAVLLRPGR
jgi:exopolysaccharide biosynthesis polyprenyl glycosylphosphotransferase